MLRRPHYAWIVLGVTFVALLAGAGIRATPGVLIVPLEAAFGAGWIRTNLGDYQLVFWSSGALCLLAAVLALQVGVRPARRAATPARVAA